MRAKYLLSQIYEPTIEITVSSTIYQATGLALKSALAVTIAGLSPGEYSHRVEITDSSTF